MVLIEVADLQTYKFFRNPLSTLVDALKLHFKAKIPVKDSLSELKKLQFEYAVWLSDMIKFEVAKAIKTQNFPMRYALLKSGKKEFWLDTAYLLNHITVWWDVEDKTCYIGVPENVVYPGTSTKVSDVIKWNELGHKTRNPRISVPARPLLIPLANRLVMEHKVLFKQFIGNTHPEIAKFLA